MGKLASKTTKRIMASLLTIAMIMSNMTVYASEYSEPAAKTEDAVENTETGAVELPSTDDETVQGDEAQDEGTQDGTADDKASQEGTEGDAQDTDASDENSNPGNDEEGGAVSEPEMDGEEVQEPEEPNNNLEAEEPNENVTRATAHTVWVVGDSTVSAFNDKYYYPRYGYGTQIQNYISEDSGYTVRNLALSGRSSLSYLKESEYKTLTDGIKSEDILIVGFGHNDEKRDDATRYTDPNGDWQTTGSFAKNLWDNYVNMAKTKGAEVILCTPIVRRGTGTDSETGKTKLSSSEKHITNGGDYSQAVVKLGSDKSIPVVDLTGLTTTLYESMTPAETVYFHAWTRTASSSVDNTHLNIYGAKKVAYMLANEVKTKNLTALAGAIKTDITEPTKDNDLVSRPGHEDPVYTAPGDNPSSVFDPYVTGTEEKPVKFIGTAFGDIGGDSKVSSFKLGKDRNGYMNIVSPGNGKLIISGDANDGLAMYYYRVPKDSLFTLSATAVVNSIASETQSAFGLMARDDMYINVSSNSSTNPAVTNTNYVVAGSNGTGAYNCFYRKDGDLTSNGSLPAGTIKKGGRYNLSIVRSDTDGYACTFDDQETQSGGYDLSLLSVDSEYIYIGMFTMRNADVTFKNIRLVVDGKVLVDETKNEYDITVSSDENGTASANLLVAAENDVIELEAAPKSGYVLDGWEVKPKTEGTDALAVVNNEFTMPADDVTVKAAFAQSKFANDYVAKGTQDYTASSASLTGFAGVTFANVEDTDNAHGFHTAEANKNPIVNLNLDLTGGKTANITVLTCSGAGSAARALDSSSGVVLEKEVEDGAAKGTQYSIEKITDEHVTLTLANNMYIHSISVDYIEPDTSTKIDVWDFGAKAEEDEKYRNNITAAELSKYLNMYSGNAVLGDGNSGGTAEFGDLTIKYGKGDRIYADKNKIIIKGITFQNFTSAATTAYDDYTAEGGWYSNGARDSSTGVVTISNVNAGDKIIAYMGNHQNGGSKFKFEYQGSDGNQADEVEVAATAFKKFVFVAKYTGQYQIYQSDKTNNGKPMHHRIMRVPTVDVSGTIDLNGNTISGYGLKFINQTDKTLPDITATVAADGSYTAKLSAGYTYRALLTGVSGYGIVSRESADKVTTTDAESVTGKTDVNFKVESQTTYEYSGSIEGFASSYDVSKLAITMVPTADFDANEVELSIDKTNMTFNAELSPNVRYTFEMEGVNDYEVKSPADICKEDQSSFTGKTITVALKPMYDVIGGFIGLGDGVTVNSLIFTNVDDQYKYTAKVANGGYSISLRDGEYIASAVVSKPGYSTKTHVIVDGGMVSQDLFFVSSANKESIDYVSDIYVGYPKQDNNYATVSEAVEAAGLMKKDNKARTENDRVNIHIAPGTYREQIIVNIPGISFVNDTNEEVLLTWYYGIGYVYYSAANGYYNAENAYDKYTKGKVEKWGVAVYLQDGADGFRAEGITFENSFNRYITDEELADGVEPAVKYTSDKLYSDTSIAVDRKYGVDVTSKTATERAAAIAIEADKVEFKDCGFYSSQDTLYTGSSKKVTRIYFKNCVLEGQTDYLFGGGDVVFDACELSWKGYSTGSQGGYITAYRQSDKLMSNGAYQEKGYLFRNCTVTANNHNNLTVTKGYFGRPWGAKASVIFMNTKLQNADIIEAAGWTSMNKVDPKDADFHEYNTTSLDGKTVSTVGRPQGTVMSEDAAKKIKVSDYFGTSWTPTYYTADATGDVTCSDLTITDNGDINVPNPGHTLTVNYDLSGSDAANDVSTIKWYIVEDLAGTNPKLEKTSTAAVDKTYKITTAAAKKYIKVEVMPETIDGRTGETKSLIFTNQIGENYVDPSTGSNITIGDGINIYLAGDSTVKDYSAKGMWNGGNQSEDLGSWGEYLQSFFNESEVTVQNFAEGGRSVRSFINDDTGDKKKFSVIKANISEGDYLFIQFGHNDSSVSEKKADVYTPIGDKVNGKYPYTEGTVNATTQKYPDYYKWENGAAKWIDDGTQGTATYCWFLQQYINMAIEAGATPVLMTPVARQNYDSEGKTKDCHADEKYTNSYYWEAVKQVYEDNQNREDGKKVLLIDTYALTKALFDDAYKDGGATRGKEIMNIKDATHNNKLGGMVEAMIVAEEIQKLDTTLAYLVKTPAQVSGETITGKTVFSINSSSNFTAYEQKFTGEKESAAYTDDTFTTQSVFWSNYGNEKLKGISAKAGELADSNVSASMVAAPKATSTPSDDANGNPILTVELTSATDDVTIYYTDDGVTSPKNSDGTKSDAAKTYNKDEKIVLTEDTIIKAFATAANKTASKVVTFNFSVTPDVEAPTANKPTGSTIASGTVIRLTTNTKNAEIRYSMGNGSKISDPTVSSPLYDEENGLIITNSTTIKAIAVKSGVMSNVATFTYVVDANAKGTVVKPTANVASGATVALNQKITLRTSTPDAKIYYTTDRSEPTKDKTLYGGPIKIEASMADNNTIVIKAIALRDDMDDSEVATFTYTYDPNLKLTAEKPVADPPTGSEVHVGDIVTLSSSTDGAKIIYTTDKSEPSATSTNASASPVSVTIDANMVSNKKVTIKAIAVCDDTDVEASGVATFTYDIEGSSGGDSNITIDKDGGIEIVGLDPSYPYTGAAVTPDFKVVDNGVKIDNEPKELTLGVDYTVKYKNNKKAGKATVTVVGKGNYAGKDVERSFTIEEVNDVEEGVLRDLTGVKIDKIDAETYTGEAKYPEFKLILKDKSHVEYIYKYDDSDPDKGQYVIKSGNGEGTADINVAVSNNINKGTATILVTGKKNAKNKVTSVKKTFKINPVDLSKAGTKLNVDVADSVPYAVKGATPEVKVSYNFITDDEEDNWVPLVNGKDYTVKYSANKKVGEGKFTITGKGNYAKKYTGNKSKFTIEKLDMANTDLVDLVAVTAYKDLKASKVKAVVVDENGDIIKANQYTVEVYKDAEGTNKYNANDKIAEKIYVKAVAKTAKNANLTSATEPIEFNVGENIAKAKVKLKVKSMEYTGAAIELEDNDLEVTIKLKGEKTPKTLTMANEDFEIVSYSNNINKGTATAVIKGIGDYSGTKTIKFKITAKTMKKQTATD